MTYLLISAPFIAAAAGLWGWRRRGGRRQAHALALVLAVLCGLTVIFDNLMVAAGLYDYRAGNTAGIFLGRIPAEDLLYPVFAALVATAFWPGGDA